MKKIMFKNKNNGRFQIEVKKIEKITMKNK